MGFEVTETETKDNMPPRAKVSYLRGSRVSKKHKPDYDNTKDKPKLLVTIPTTLCGVAKSPRFELMIGSGQDEGKIRIKGTENQKKGVKVTQLRHCFNFKFGFVPKFGYDIFDQNDCEVRRLSDEEYEIDLFPERKK